MSTEDTEIEIVSGKKQFEGIVELYDETFYVNTESGVGLDSILKKIDPLLNKMASGTYIIGHNFEDVKQELVIIAIDGIASYNPEKEVKLSTFLHIHLRNKLISKLRSENKMSKDAYSYHGTKTKPVSGESKIKRIREEVYFSACKSVGDKDGGFDPSLMFENTISEEGGLYGERQMGHEEKDFELTLSGLEGAIDDKTLRAVKLICYNDFSMKRAAEEVGLTGWAVSMRIKKLFENEEFSNAFGEHLSGYMSDAKEG